MSKNQIIIGYTSKLTAEGFEKLVDGFDDFEVLKLAPIGKELSKFLKSQKHIDILILELDCPHKYHLEYIDELVATYTFVKILVLSLNVHNEMSSKILESGIDGYLLKSCGEKDLLTALDKLIEGKSYFCSEITKNLMTGNNQSNHKENIILTPREKEILSLLANCKTNIDIAQEMGLSENTIKTHRRNIQSKFGAHNLLGMIRYACRSNLINFGQDEYCMECPHRMITQN